MKKDLVSLHSYSSREIEDLLDLTSMLKSNSRDAYRPLANKTAALIFEKPSLRTHISFQVGISQLGGESFFLSQQHIGLSTRESVKDVAEVLSCYNDLIVARTMKHETVEELAAFATVPVINALTDLLHPCQILADAYTLRERGLLSETTRIAFIGDGNNVVNSWLELAEKVPFHFVLGCPGGYEPDRAILARAQKARLSRIEITHDPFAAAENADVLYTDVWVSMGQEAERESRRKAFASYQVNDELLQVAARNCLVMHCLPAHRGEEITASVIDGPRSIILEQAENRLHVQKAIMVSLLSARENPLVRTDHSLHEVVV